MTHVFRRTLESRGAETRVSDLVAWTHRRLGPHVTGRETLDLEPWSFPVSSLEAVEEEGDVEMREAEDPGGPVDDAGEEEDARAGE
eukprot:5042395-Pyramimonas_sp.AAC.1